MKLNNNRKSYNSFLIFENNEIFQTKIYNHAQFLIGLGAFNLIVIRKSNYKSIKTLLIQFSFSISPKALKTYRKHIKFDKSIRNSFLTLIA